MLQQIVGNVDVPAAAVLIAFFLGVGIVSTTWFTRHQSKAEIELQRMKAEAEDRRAMYDAETRRGLETKKLEQNLITSHRED